MIIEYPKNTRARVHLPSLLLGTLLACGPALAATPSAPVAPPKLVVVLVVDGLPNEQVQRYHTQFGQGGFRRLLDQGAWFGNAHQAHGITLTAVGHSAVLSGAYPYQHGIIGNHWIDPETGKASYCTEDRAHRYIGNEETEPDDGTSPKRLRVSTLGDELRYATGNQAKVVTVSGKDRGAILLAGKTGTAYMYMDKTGNFASSTWYMQQHPAWATTYLANKPQDRYLGKAWTPLLAPAAYAGDASEDIVPLREGVRARFPFPYSDAGKPDAAYYNGLKTSPALDELTLDFARAAVDGENLGRNRAGVTDILGVSLSAHDYVNHTYGPESKMAHDHLQQLDRMLARFFDYLDTRIGMDNVLVVLTADHGFANVPEYLQAQKIDAGRFNFKDLAGRLEQHLATTLGVPKLVRTSLVPHIYLDYAAASKAGIKRGDLEDAATRFIMEQPGVAEVFTRTQMESGAPATRMGMLMRRAWNRQLSGDLVVAAKPHWIMSSDKGTTHGSPYTYDSNVPLMLMGPRWIKPGAYPQYAEVVDIAPTLAHLLRVRPPAAAEGRVLNETLR